MDDHAPPSAGAPGPPAPDVVSAWSRAHGTPVPGPPAVAALVRGWLRGVRAMASPLVRAGVSPDAVTAVGCVVTLAAVPAAAAGGRWAILAAALLGLGALLDGLDGAVARLSGRESTWGAVLDAVADRVGDAAALAVLWLIGAPGWLVLVALGAGLAHEYTRARAQGEGMTGPGAVTVSERPTRVAVAAMFALGCGLHPATAVTWAGLGAAVAAALAGVGLLQVLRACRRLLTG